MSDREWFRELAPDPYEDEEAISYIVAEMDLAEELAHSDDDRGRGVKLDEHRDALRWLLRKARRVHREVKSDWLRRNEDEGSEWRPHRRLERNIDPDEPEEPYDYGELAGGGLEGLDRWGRRDDWDVWWRGVWGRGRGNPGGFRGHPGVPKPPLIAIYFVVNQWWRRVLHKPFWPDFTSGLDAADTDPERLAHLGPAARLFLLVANEVDKSYTADRCKKVHDDYYGRLPKRRIE